MIRIEMRESRDVVTAARAEAAAWLADGYVPCGIDLQLDLVSQAIQGATNSLNERQPVLEALLAYVRCPTLYMPLVGHYVHVASLDGDFEPTFLALLGKLSPSSAETYVGVYTASDRAVVRVEGWAPRWVALQVAANASTEDSLPSRQAYWDAWAKAWWAEASAGRYEMGWNIIHPLLHHAVQRIRPADWPMITLRRYFAWVDWQHADGEILTEVLWARVLHDLVKHPMLWACL